MSHLFVPLAHRQHEKKLEAYRASGFHDPIRRRPAVYRALPRMADDPDAQNLGAYFTR